MKFQALLLAAILPLSGPTLVAQAPRQPKPKPVEEVPPPDLGPMPTSPQATAPEQKPGARTWAMFDGGPWPSEEQMKVVANFCNIGGERTAPYNLGPDARETAMLEAAAADIRRVRAQWQTFPTG